MSALDVSSSPNQRWLAKEFANSFEQSHRSIPHEVHAYVEFARHLSKTKGPEPDPDFRAALRYRLLHELIEDDLVPGAAELRQRRQEQVPGRKGGSHCFERAPREPWIAAASTVLVVCGGAVGLGHESSQAAPSEVLYPVKRFIESGELALADSPSGEARELMEQAAHRLGEARQLATTDEIHAQQALSETLVDFNEAAAEAGQIVVAQSRGYQSDPDLLSEYQSFSTASYAVLDQLASTVDGPTRALIDDARATLDNVDQRLPVLDQVLHPATEDLPTTAKALNVLGLGEDEHAEEVSESALDPVEFEPEGILDDAVHGAADTLTETVSVVEVSASDEVSVAVATVHRTVDSVHHTVDSARHTVARATDAVDDLTDDQDAAELTDAAKDTLQNLQGDAPDRGLLSGLGD